MYDKNYENLANAIVVRAVDDYRELRKKLKKDLGNEKAIPMMLDVIRFLRSSWYQMLTTVDGEIILKHLQEEKI